MRALAATLSLLASLALASCEQPLQSPVAVHSFERTVVASTAPLALSNPQKQAVTWPIWGSAFFADEPVAVRVSVRAGGDGTAGIVFAGEGAPHQRRGVGLVAHGGMWLLRETLGETIVQELAVAAPVRAELVIELSAGARTVRVVGHGGDQALATMRPLVGPRRAAGIYVHLSPGAELVIRELALTQPLPRTRGLGVALRQAAARQGLAVGAATDVWPPRHDPGFETLLGEQFNAAAPTELYWSTTRGEDEDFFFVPADLMINYATLRDQAITGYFLVWSFELPAWLRERARTAPASLGKVLDEHIATVVGRYRDRVDAWVVVNEAVWGPEESRGAATYARTVWLDALGPEYIERAFRAARAADANAVLLYNETGAEALGPKSDFVHDMLADLLARGVPVDGVGLQFHVDAAKPLDLASVKANMQRLAALGLEIHITELDVSLAKLDGSAAAKLERQAEIYAGVLETCLAVPACRAYTVFGISDTHAWDELGDASPLLFDERYRAKPAFKAIQQVLAR